MIENWLPPPVTNTSRQRHWAVVRQEILRTKTRVLLTARVAGWRFVPGRVRLTVTLVFDVHRARDTDNTVARVKHLVDGLKEFFTDDSSELLDLVVHAEVDPGHKKATRVVLEAI